MKERSEGSRLLNLACQAHTQAGVAAKVGVSRQAVTSWLSAHKHPSEQRMAQLSREFGIPREAWYRPPSPPSAAPAGVPAAASPAEGSTSPSSPLETAVTGQRRGRRGPSTYERARAHVQSCDQAIADNPNASPRELCALLNARATALRALAACTPNWAWLLDSEEWRSVENGLVRALEGHKEAAAAVAAEMERVIAEGEAELEELGS